MRLLAFLVALTWFGEARAYEIAWTKLSDGDPVNPIGHSSRLVSDPAIGQVYLWGPSGLYRWTGTTWQILSDLPTSSLPAATWDPRRRELLAHGGRIDGQISDRFFTWNGSDWREPPVLNPRKRRYHAMAFDRVRQVAILHGGDDEVNGQDVALGDAWEWNGTRWSEIASAPGKRSGHSLTQPLYSNKVYLVGSGATWTLDSEGWKNLGLGAPIGTYGVAAVSFRDAIQGDVVVVFGGYAGGTVGLVDSVTLLVGGVTTVVERPIGSIKWPAPRKHAAMAVLGPGEWLMFGGTDDVTDYSDTWKGTLVGFEPYAPPLRESPFGCGCTHLSDGPTSLALALAFALSTRRRRVRGKREDVRPAGDCIAKGITG